MVEISGSFAEQPLVQRNASGNGLSSPEQRDGEANRAQQNLAQSDQNIISSNSSDVAVEQTRSVTGTPTVNPPSDPASPRENITESRNNGDSQQRFVVDQITLSREAQARLQADAQDPSISNPVEDIEELAAAAPTEDEGVQATQATEPDDFAADETLSAEDTGIAVDTAGSSTQLREEEAETANVAQSVVVSSEERIADSVATNQTPRSEANASVINGNLDGQQDSNQALGQIVDQFA